MQFLDQFDPASPTECFERPVSVSPQQALALQNSILTLNMARVLAKDLAKENSDFVAAAFERVLGREPTRAERQRCESFLKEQTALYQEPSKLTPFPAVLGSVIAPSTDPAQHAREDLIQVLYNHNDFVTVR